MPIWDRDLQIKKWDPRILLHSGRNSFLGWLGTKYNAIALNGVAFSNIKTVKTTLGVYGKAGCDFNFTAPVNTTAQNKDLGAIIPAYARVLEVKIVCEEAPTGLTSMALVAGNVSAGAQFLASVQCFSLHTVVATLLALLWTVAPTAAASNIWVQGTPGSNWSLDTTNVGYWSIYTTYIDVI
jgi:hypothetical protein